MNANETATFRPKTETEQNIWGYINSRDKFSYAELEAHFPIPRYTIRTLVRQMKRMGCIRVAQTKGNRVYYTAKSVINEIENKVQKRSSPEGAMWTAIRMLGPYTAEDVACSLSGTDLNLSQQQVKTYMQRLLSAGYLRVVRRATPDRGREAVYLLINDTGPLPPIIRRKRVIIDQNEERVVFVEGVK